MGKDVQFPEMEAMGGDLKQCGETCLGGIGGGG